MDFDVDLVIPLTVTVDQQFQLSFSAGMNHSVDVRVDMFDTASVSFDLPPGMSITSTKGFGAPIPEPSTLTLAALGIVTLLTFGRRRQRTS